MLGVAAGRPKTGRSGMQYAVSPDPISVTLCCIGGEAYRNDDELHAGKNRSMSQRRSCSMQSA